MHPFHARPIFAFALALALAITSVSEVALASEMDQRASLGPLQGLPTRFNTTALGTTAVQATLPTAAAGTANIRVKIVNGSSTATVAWLPVVRGSAAPTITADYNSTTGAIPIPPQGWDIFVLPGDRDLYIVASAATTSASVTSFLQQ